MDKKTLEKAIKILKAVEEAGKDGIWLTEIGKSVRMHRTTVARMIDRHLTEFVTQDIVPPFNLRMIRLKPDSDMKGIIRYLMVKEKIDAIRNSK